jgi:predicted GIY-YIG superfamily endonuclease
MVVYIWHRVKQHSNKNSQLRGIFIMATKSASYNKSGISKLPEDKPVVYKIQSESGKNNYTGIAQRGRVQDRLTEHLPGGKDYVPGSKVHIEQTNSITEARAKESRIISRSKPKYNKQGK